MSIGAVAMSASTMIVAVNAQLLRRLNLRRAAHSLITSPVALAGKRSKKSHLFKRKLLILGENHDSGEEIDP